MKKKLVVLVLIGSMALSFTACGNSSDSSKGTKETSKKTEVSAETPKGNKGRSQRACRADWKMGI